MGVKNSHKTQRSHSPLALATLPRPSSPAVAMNVQALTTTLSFLDRHLLALEGALAGLESRASLRCAAAAVLPSRNACLTQAPRGVSTRRPRRSEPHAGATNGGTIPKWRLSSNATLFRDGGIFKLLSTRARFVALLNRTVIDARRADDARYTRCSIRSPRSI